MDWKQSGWVANVEGLVDGRYEVTYCVYKSQYEAWFWPAPYAGYDGECVIRHPNGGDFETLGEAQDACEAHMKARGKLRAV